MAIRIRTSQELNTIQEQNLLAEGTYKFSVKTASDEYSKSGNPMIKLLLEVYTGTGKIGIYDYLVDVDSMAFKVKHFCETTGIEAHNLSAIECINHEGEVEIKIDKASNGYPAKNKVHDYFVRDKVPSTKNENEVLYGEKFNDDIPF